LSKDKGHLPLSAVFSNSSQLSRYSVVFCSRQAFVESNWRVKLHYVRYVVHFMALSVNGWLDGLMGALVGGWLDVCM